MFSGKMQYISDFFEVSDGHVFVVNNHPHGHNDVIYHCTV